MLIHFNQSFDCSSVHKNPTKGDQRQIIRRKFKPDIIKVLFACESLPNETKNFFYYRSSPLFRYTLKAFQKCFPQITQANFLEQFCGMGFYLDDLCDEPVNQLSMQIPEEKKKRLCLRRLYERNFTKRLELYKPNYIIITPNGIKENIVSCIKSLDLEIPYSELPFPSHKRIYNYVDQLVQLLHSLIENKLVDESSK